MKLYVPEISDRLLLTEDWTFQLHPEFRNDDFAMVMLGMETRWLGSYLAWFKDGKEVSIGLPPNSSMPVAIPAGMVLIVERIYVRKGASDFSSLTFRIKKEKGAKIYGRFWAKLDDCNRIEFTRVQD
jgi:hypothetical protein